MRETVLVLMVKRPLPGQGKQRLTPVLGEKGAEKIAQALLACALEDCQSWPGPVTVSPACPEDAGWASKLLPQAWVIPQIGGGLGERLNAIDRILRDRGSRRIVFMGCDAPGLSEPDFSGIRMALIERDMVISPASDGGAVLLGSRCPWPDLGLLPWSTPALYQTLVRLCQDAGRTVASLRRGFDVDHPEDLATAYSALEGDPRPARRAFRSLVGRFLESTESSLWGKFEKTASGNGKGSGEEGR